MIRPLEFCQSDAHIQTSIDTIDFRLLELLALREKYTAKAKHVKEQQPDKDTHTTSHTLMHDRIRWAQSLGYSPQEASDIFENLFKNLIKNELHSENVFKKNIGNR